jgi:hypothetical protein
MVKYDVQNVDLFIFQLKIKSLSKILTNKILAIN